VQRAYRARLAAAGKVVRLVDTASLAPNPPPAAIPDFNPAIDGVYERAMIENWRDHLHNALVKLELREQDVARLNARNAYLEGELKLLEQHHTNAVKEIVTLKQALARQGTAKPRKK
jgi:hypothetical protein